MGAAYSLEYLEEQRAKFPLQPQTVPPFPALGGDPLVPLYVQGMEFAADAHAANAFERRVREFDAAQPILAHKPRHDAFLAAVRIVAWVRCFSPDIVGPRGHRSWASTSRHLADLVDELARADSKLNEQELEELLSHTRLIWRDGGFFPIRGTVAAHRFAAKRFRLSNNSYAVLFRCVRAIDGYAGMEATFRSIVDLFVERPTLPAESDALWRSDHASAGNRLFENWFQGMVDFKRAAVLEKRPFLADEHLGQILGAPEGAQARVLSQCLEKLLWWARGFPDADRYPRGHADHVKHFIPELRFLAIVLIRRAPPSARPQHLHLLTQFADAWGTALHSFISIIDALAVTIRYTERRQKFDRRTRAALEQLRDQLADIATACPNLEALLSDPRTFPIENGDVWADRAITLLRGLDHEAAQKWSAIIHHAKAGSSSAPSAKWLKQARELASAVGIGTLRDALLEWFPLADKPRPSLEGLPHWRRHELLMHDDNLEALKGLCWFATVLPDQHGDLSRALGKLAISAYRKVPGIGPRAVKVGNAAVYALGHIPGMDALGQLAMLRVKVKFGTAQKGIEKALNAAAAREGLPRDQIDELGVPSYGLTEVGRRTEQLGDFTVELIASGIGDTELRFTKADGKRIKSVPAALKADHAEELKELKAAAKDIAAMLPAQKDRLDSLFLDNKLWPLSTWRERYLDHPLVGIIARRLIWSFGDPNNPKGWKSATWLDTNNALVDQTGAPFAPPESCSVRLWHPIESPGGRDEVLAWRRFFEDRQIRQPFKQAHREVYLLTDAERTTNTYSNRFAAHIIKQHQFHALCAARNWKNKLRLMVDAEYPPATRLLPAFGLRAEFWIEGSGEEVNEAYAYLYLATDQVRFYPLDAEQASGHAWGGGYRTDWRNQTVDQGIPLDETPPLVLSEVLRDVDLFVGVCSITNNPDWQDGGPQGTHREYWWGQSFGEISETGAGRRELLQRILPRLKIASQCTLTDKFLVVKGSRRTYKIHLGSGNILMEPNDQYLCIVPTSRDASGATAAGVFLPFEGDRTLSIILSKAFLLAADDKISDPSINSQIKWG